MESLLLNALSAAVQPIGLSLGFVVAGLVCRRQSLAWLGVSILLLCSIPVTSSFMVRAVENWAERGAADSIPQADAIVVLSTGRSVAPGAYTVSEWTDADRFYGGVELYRAGKAPLLLFTGGWRRGEPVDQTEGRVLLRYAEALGIPASHMATTGPVTRTVEEARATAALLRKDPENNTTLPHVILVTSALHMRRARFLFEESGLQVSPFPVDFRAGSSLPLSVNAFLPKASVLGDTDSAWREVYGHIFYSVRRFMRPEKRS